MASPPPVYANSGDYGAPWAGACHAYGDVGGFDGGCCNLCPCPTRLWFRGDFLMWWGKAANLPPLVTTSPAGTAQDEAGILGQTDTSILFGGQRVDPGFHPGGRFTLGWWTSPCEESGIEATYLFLGSKSVEFNQASASGDPILARPFFNVDTSLQDAVLVAFPDVAIDSQIGVTLSSELQSFDLLSRGSIFRDCGRRVDFLLGYRYSRFAERLAINQSFTAGPESVAEEGTIVEASDVFTAGNEFHGVELGIAAQTECCRWWLEGMAKLALGATRSRVIVDGTTVTAVPDEAPATTPGALLAQPTNIGRYSQCSFSAIPELDLTIGYNVSRRMKATFGYSLLYWSQVARPGDQIDVGRVSGSNIVNVNVNPTQFSGGELTGVPAPQYRFITTDFWAQGLTFGIDCRF